MECEEGEFREWADRHFAAADYRKTDAGARVAAERREKVPPA